MNSNTRIIDRGWKRLKAELLELQNVVVDVGIQAGTTSNNGQDLASIAAYNEFGTARIPSRPFMRASFDENVERINRASQDVIRKVIDRKISSGQALHVVGQTMTGIIQRKIVDGDWKANALRTIQQKRSDQPLIDTGRMRQSVRHVVRKR